MLDVFRTPKAGYQDYTVVVIDTTDFENGGELNIDIKVGRNEGEGDFYLFDGEIVPFSDEKTPKNTLDRTGCGPGETGQITRRFYNGQLFRLGATGQPDRAAPCVNAFRATVSVREILDEEHSDADTSVTSSTELRALLDSTQPSQEILNIFRAPGSGYQDYTVVNVDTTAFEDGGTLNIYIRVGGADASGSFDLFAGGAKLPNERILEALVSAWGVKPNTYTTIRHGFERGEVFKLGAAGDWFSEKGDINAFYLRISVEEN